MVINMAIRKKYKYEMQKKRLFFFYVRASIARLTSHTLLMTMAGNLPWREKKSAWSTLGGGRCCAVQR